MKINNLPKITIKYAVARNVNEEYWYWANRIVLKRARQLQKIFAEWHFQLR